MRDMNLEMGGEFFRLDSVLSGRQLPAGFVPCDGGCERLVLDGDRFCHPCQLLNAQMEARRLADAKKLSIYMCMDRAELGVAVMDAEMPEPLDEKVPFTEDPFAQLAVGLAVTFGGFVAFWYGIPPLVGFCLWLSSK